MLVVRCPSQPLGRRRRGVRAARGAGLEGGITGAGKVVAGGRERDRRSVR